MLPGSAQTRRLMVSHRLEMSVPMSVSDMEEDKSQYGSDSSTRFVVDPAGENTYDETTVDVVTVPCPGADGLQSWSRDGLVGRYFGAPSMRDAEALTARHGAASGPSWVRQGIRREAPRARILLYAHPPLMAGSTLADLADDLLQELRALRTGEAAERPLVFIAHSIGGLVVKMALTKAARHDRYESVLRECYGVAFFGTPHQGSGYFAMPGLASSIQSLLRLSAPLPASMTESLRVGNDELLRADDDFKAISNDMRIWTFYETIESRFAAPEPRADDVYFTAPLTSSKSAILGMRQESILALQSDHANMASFGRHNGRVLHLFLRQLASLIGRADMALRHAADDAAARWSLDLEHKVSVEVHGFFDDTDSESTIRAWSTRLPLCDFLAKGPLTCLSERLNEVDDADADAVAHVPEPVMTVGNALGLGVHQPGPLFSPHLYPTDAKRGPMAPSPRAASPPATVRSSPPTRPSSLVRADLEQDLAVDRLSPPLRPRIGRAISRSFSDGFSRIEYREFVAMSPRSRSALDDQDDDIEASPRLPDALVAIRKAVNMTGIKGRVMSPTNAVKKAPAGFAKPDVKARRFVWVHVPYNNPTWVKSVLQTLEAAYDKNLSVLYGHDFWAARHTRGRHAQHYAYFAKPGCYVPSPRTLSPGSRTAAANEAAYVCLFLPYLHFDSYRRLIRRRNLIRQRLRHGRARPVPESVAKADLLELQVVWEYLGHDPPVNCRRTLDQFGHPSLRDTRSRDDDQMLYKLTKDRSLDGCPEPAADIRSQGSSAGTAGAASDRAGSGASTTSGGWRERLLRRGGTETAEDGREEETVLDGKVLMVDQLWLWAIDSRTLVSFFPKRESDPTEGPLFQQADLRDSIFNDVNVDLTRQCENALDLAALAALHAVSVLLDRSSHPDLEVFRLFDEAISALTEKLTWSLKAFRVGGFSDKAPQDDDHPVESIRARHRQEARQAELDNRDSTAALLELRDIEDELLMLSHLFDQQSKVLSAMHGVYLRPDIRDVSANGRVFLSEALRRLRDHGQRAGDMVQRVRSTRDDYDKLLQMVQRQAQVDEVRLSRLHADLAGAQSRSVTIFTTFTVIFLPLTFFTGLFGMNTRQWGGGGNLPLETIASVSLPSSFVIVGVALVIAYSSSVRTLPRRIARRVLALMVGLAAAAAAAPSVDRFGDGSVAGRRRRGPEREVSDFWSRHRLGRDRGDEES
ncbi:ankyrin repeat protein [Ophiocordyceps camponoti-floridani]|uniref:Ankyrin repeat protein n=1 Tax=Ophiocordyceps camponoti-floridani TaxID=2030778 RepID=A0A8H4VH85_9HYPO|nr:ankyrin repeat protein [Ophiocordyceps camponoti-floridani]